MNIKNLQRIYKSENSTIYKCNYPDLDKDIIIKVLNAEYPTEEQLTRFNNEFEFTKNLEIRGVRKIIKKYKKDEKNALILEYFPGKTLKHFIKNYDGNIENSLKAACEISQITGEIHRQNIIHKDINSNNILINENNEIKIIDFGIATKYTLKTQNLANPNHLEGTLAYISPEQTGRMNRSVDYRTDLYSLGIVLYEIFTKKLPFPEDNSMELIHSHIAKTPIPPHKINNKIPKILSEIIVKLLSKNAEDRYQSAFGLKYDLEKILNDKSKKYDFKLGKKDFSGILAIPEKLYGRENEIEKLYRIYENVSYGEKELLLISGYSGVGKSALIHEIHKPLTKKRGFYIEGKFEQFQKNIPYYAIIHAFTDFINLILKENDEELNYRKIQIQEAVGNIGGVLTNIIPELELIIGKQPELPELEGKEAQNRFNYVWSNFVKAISTDDNPLVIFMDDLHRADNASIKLLQNLLTDPEIKYFFCIIAYRKNEIDVNILHEFENLENIKTSKIKLCNLNKNDVNNLVSDSLNSQNKNYSKTLSDLIYSKTSGNAFFTVQFLKNLYEEELLKFDFKQNIWKWNFHEIEKQKITDNVVKLLTKKIKKLPEKTQDILKIASCIGNRFDLKILSVIYEKETKTCKKNLEPAIFENLIFPCSKQNYKFVHDKIQQAVYFTIPDNKKSNFHLQTGKLLLKFLDKKNLEKRTFDVVNQLNRGKNLITDKAQKRKLVELNYKAGMKAKSSSAYLPAYNYFENSINLSGKNCWQRDYDFTLKIYNELAELSYLTAFYDKTENYVNIIIENTTEILHKANAYYSLINAYRAQSLFAKAVESGLKILSEFGVNFPENPSKINVIVNLIKIYFRLKRLGYSKFVGLPLITNKHIEAQIKLIDSIGSSVLTSKRSLLPLLIFKGIDLILNSGHSKSSPYFISAHGLILGTLNKIKQAHEMGKIANEIQKKYKFNRIKCRTTFVNLSFVLVWKAKLIKIKNILWENYKTGLETGDFEFASSSLYTFSYFSMFCDTNLSEIKNFSLENLNQMKKLNQKLSLARFMIFIQTLHNLSDKNYYINNISSEKYFDHEKNISVLIKEKDYISLGLFYNTRIFLIYILYNIDKMENIIEKISKYQAELKGYYYYALINFYHSLCLLAIFENKDKKQKKEILKKVKENQKQMNIWTKYCPENYQNKYDLVEAEKYRILGKPKKAKMYYDKAIKGANKSRFLSEEAISWEAASRFYMKKQNKILAKIYFQNAYKTYKSWGATAKLKQLEEKYPQFILEKQGSITITSSTSTIVSGASTFDLTSIVKASQSLSGEMKMEKLLKNMLMIIMENAGADYAVIIKNEAGKFLIEAEGKYNSENIKVLQSEDLENTKAVALNIVKYVIRTRKILVIDNANKDEKYSANIYIKKNKVKSVLCYPVIHKSRLVAILYLENNLATHVFTSERIETINILSSQIAVSIENALLYENLEYKVKLRTAELQEKNEELKTQKYIIEENEKKIRTITNSANDAIILMNNSGNIEFWNKAAQKIFGYTKNEILYKNLHATLVPEKYIESFNKGFVNFKKTGKGNAINKTLELEAKRKNGEIFSVEISLASIKIKGKWNAVGIVKDITERKQAEQKLKQQKAKIEESHKHIRYGINYASRIQAAMLPTHDFFRENFADYFILFKPLDIVSGDFYWAKKINDTLIYAAADCTGHGVPGAFVSMLGMSLLNEISAKQETFTANEILENLRIAIKTSLKQNDKKYMSKDGMDISLCIIELKNKKLQFSGAYNSLYIIRNEKIIQLKADRQPIGIHRKEKSFTNHEFQLQKDDVLYSFSDGFIDQFGGANMRKFMAKNFKKLLLSIHKNPMQNQKTILETEFDNWRGKIKQVDDIVIIGTKI